MSYKVSYTHYEGAPAATFWSKLGGALGYLLMPCGGLALIFGIYEWNLSGFKMWLWIIGCIVVTVGLIIGEKKFCGMMEDRAYEKAVQQKIPDDFLRKMEPDSDLRQMDSGINFQPPTVQPKKQVNTPVYKVICPHCGKSIYRGAKYCSCCGKMLPDPGSLKPSQELEDQDLTVFSCAACGHTVHWGDAYCSFCGRKDPLSRS